VAALAVAAVHLAGAQRRLGFQRAEVDAHLLQGLLDLGAPPEGGAQLGQGGAAYDHPSSDQRLAQAGLHRVGTGAVAEQLDQDRGVDGDHAPPSSRRRSTASVEEAKPSSANLPRAREMASSTLLRRMMRLPSSSTFSRVPLVSPRASRTGLGSVIWPRSATVASMVGLRRMVCGHDTYHFMHTQSGVPALSDNGPAKTVLSCQPANNDRLKPSAASPGGTSQRSPQCAIPSPPAAAWT